MKSADLQTSRPIIWVTKEDAALLLDKSERTVLAMAAAGTIQSKQERVPEKGNQKVTLLHAGDIERLRFQRSENGTAMQLRKSAAVQPAALQPVVTPVTPSARPWLTIEEAEEYSGLPAGFLLKYISLGKLAALNVGPRKGGQWRVARRDLDALQAVFMKPMAVAAVAL